MRTVICGRIDRKAGVNSAFKNAEVMNRDFVLEKADIAVESETITAVGQGYPRVVRLSISRDV